MELEQTCLSQARCRELIVVANVKTDEPGSSIAPPLLPMLE
jgi:hypothetical protein